MLDPEIIISPDTRLSVRIPPGQYQTREWPVLHYGSVPNISTSGWTLKIFGMVKSERTLDYKEFSTLPRVKVFSDIHCVTTWSRLDNWWEGVNTRQIKQLVELKPSCAYVIVHAVNNFTTNVPLDDFFKEDVLLATHHNNESISAEHGGPVRLVIPRLYFWKSAKWITGIEFSSEDRPGFWEKAGYHNHGDPWKEERYG